eukprot:CAMPEP_0173420968 /NCGR_PEP_ID=MMETSP1357-20121228/2240_1 /TAXON_ID=77926 /ORGANISM="Hemiselmis rufescens, Strain PCC563" /LENGTH=229 /DNA_ID=CAMNT_0014383813 /DNA_START=547 /DNA_END=1234 /DNA_ORIENTATION=-
MVSGGKSKVQKRVQSTKPIRRAVANQWDLMEGQKVLKFKPPQRAQHSLEKAPDESLDDCMIINVQGSSANKKLQFLVSSTFCGRPSDGNKKLDHDAGRGRPLSKKLWYLVLSNWGGGARRSSPQLLSLRNSTSTTPQKSVSYLRSYPVLVLGWSVQKSTVTEHGRGPKQNFLLSHMLFAGASTPENLHKASFSCKKPVCKVLEVDVVPKCGETPWRSGVRIMMGIMNIH